jgi:hypothetical protein
MRVGEVMLGMVCWILELLKAVRGVDLEGVDRFLEYYSNGGYALIVEHYMNLLLPSLFPVATF